MNDQAKRILAQLERESAETLDLAALYARTLESLAQRIQSTVATKSSTDKAALRSAALRLNHTATEGVTTLLSVIAQSARIDMLATIRAMLETGDSERGGG